jgi:site-specific DNA-methyltransferase (adenine-specific)
VSQQPAADPIPEPGHPFYRDERVTIYCADSTHLDLVDDASVDLTVTSPPYNLDVSYNGYVDDLPYEQYLEWVGLWARALLRVSRSGGRACINVPLDSNKGGKRAVYADYVRVFSEAGWQYQTTIVWNEQNISRRTAWGSWLSPSAPFVTAPVEMIPVFYKDAWRRPRGSRQTDISRDEFLAWTLGNWDIDSAIERASPERDAGDVQGTWDFPGENPRKVGHPAPFPLELPRRLIKLYSYLDDVILDPFLGSGTTAVAARVLQRRCIGIDADPSYCRIAVERLRGR